MYCSESQFLSFYLHQNAIDIHDVYTCNRYFEILTILCFDLKLWDINISQGGLSEHGKYYHQNAEKDRFICRKCKTQVFIAKKPTELNSTSRPRKYLFVQFLY